jgi:hypothetical protein
MFQINNFIKTYCPNGCELFSDNNNYTYWENNNVTSDEIEIVNYLNNLNLKNTIRILHIGIGNSYLSKNLKIKSHIDGISISNNEILNAKKLNIENYNCMFLNKLDTNTFKDLIKNNYDFIVDVNLKSFSCCDIAFNKMFSNYVQLLKSGAKILTAKNGLNWSRLLKPVYRFSLKKLIYKKLKEYDGPKRNILSIKNCNELAIINKLKFFEIKNSNIVYFES